MLPSQKWAKCLSLQLQDAEQAPPLEEDRHQRLLPQKAHLPLLQSPGSHVARFAAQRRRLLRAWLVLTSEEVRLRAQAWPHPGLRVSAALSSPGSRAGPGHPAPHLLVACGTPVPSLPDPDTGLSERLLVLPPRPPLASVRARAQAGTRFLTILLAESRSSAPPRATVTDGVQAEWTVIGLHDKTGFLGELEPAIPAPGLQKAGCFLCRPPPSSPFSNRPLVSSWSSWPSVAVSARGASPPSPACHPCTLAWATSEPCGWRPCWPSTRKLDQGSKSASDRAGPQPSCEH